LGVGLCRFWGCEATHKAARPVSRLAQTKGRPGTQVIRTAFRTSCRFCRFRSSLVPTTDKTVDRSGPSLREQTQENPAMDKITKATAGFRPHEGGGSARGPRRERAVAPRVPAEQ
jgi:hypothetical protein